MDLGNYATGITLGFVLLLCGTLGISAFGITPGFDLGVVLGIDFASGITLGFVLGLCGVLGIFAFGITPGFVLGLCGALSTNGAFGITPCIDFGIALGITK